MTPRIYLAGPTVFFRNAAERFEELEARCQHHGLQGVRPAEPVDSQGHVLNGPAAAHHLFAQNTQRIRQAHGVLADLRPFRGELEPDSGTVFEVGFAHALGKPVAALVPDARNWAQRIEQHCGTANPNAQGCAMDGRYDMLIEDFGGALNLMLSESCAVFTTEDAALAWLATQTQATPTLAMALPIPDGNALKTARTTAGLTQNEAAELLGMPLQTGSRGGLQSRTWQALENANDPRNMTGPTFALFLLLTGQHPQYQLTPKPTSPGEMRTVSPQPHQG